MEAKLKVKLLEHTPNPEKLIATAAKWCYSPMGIEELSEKLTDKEIRKFLKKLMSLGHESPVEHACFSFAVEGVSRVLTHQLVRHRIASYSQQSQRYVRLNQFAYIIPPEIADDKIAKAIFIKHMEDSQKVYDMLVDRLMEKHIGKLMAEKSATISKGQMTEKLLAQIESQAEKKAIEDARYVFPNACETKILLTMNVRSLFNFFNERCCMRAQWEIRELATQMLLQCREIAPIIFKYAGPSCLFGKCKEGIMSCGKQDIVKEIYKPERMIL